MPILIRGTILYRVSELIAELGGDGEAMVRARGIDPLATEDFSRYVAYAEAAAVLGQAARAFDCPGFGLRLGSLQGVDSLGPLGVSLRNARTVGDAVGNVCRYLGRIAPADRATISDAGSTATYTYSTILHDDFDRRQMVEKNQTIALGAFRLVAGEDFTPTRVSFQHERLAPPECYRETFGCPVSFGRERNEIQFPSAYLQRDVAVRDDAALDLAEQYFGRLHAGVSLVEHIREVTRRSLLSGDVGLRQVAQAVSLHERTLQRELAASGTAFETILDDVRKSLAWELAATGVQAAQIARTLGYAEQSGFTRACRRWFGATPRTLIQQRRGQLPEQPLGELRSAP